MQKIVITQQFKAPVGEIFPVLADHQRFGEIVDADISRIKEGQDFPNGLRSVRKISLPLGLSFEETITRFDVNKLIEYRVTRGSPIKSHLGRLEFSSVGDETLLNYTIEFEPKVAFPGWGRLLKRIIEGPIAKGLKRYADQMQ